MKVNMLTRALGQSLAVNVRSGFGNVSALATAQGEQFLSEFKVRELP